MVAVGQLVSTTPQATDLLVGFVHRGKQPGCLLALRATATTGGKAAEIRQTTSFFLCAEKKKIYAFL